MHPSEVTLIQVLLVEDDRVHRDFIAQILEKNGCRVMAAFNGREALQMVKRHQFDLVLMDVEMPEMDGLNAARHIRDMIRHGDIKALPVIAITANQGDEVQRKCSEAGMTDFISKDIWKPRWEPAIRSKLVEWTQPQQKAQPRKGNA